LAAQTATSAARRECYPGNAEDSQPQWVADILLSLAVKNCQQQANYCIWAQASLHFNLSKEEEEAGQNNLWNANASL
jgi:hypothetical protein